MTSPSSETKTIRTLIDGMSDDELRSNGPKDLSEALEKVGLDYATVRDRVNNEFARARRNRGIRKGTGRRIAAQFPTDTRSSTMFDEVLVKLEEAARNYKKMERRLAEANQFLVDLRQKANDASSVDQDSRKFTEHDVIMDCLRISTF